MNDETDYEDCIRIQVLLKGESSIDGVEKKIAKRVVKSLIEKAMRVSQGIPPNVCHLEHSKWLLKWKQAGGDVTASHPQPVGIPTICRQFDPMVEAKKLCELAAYTFERAKIPFSEIEYFSLGIQQLLACHAEETTRYRLLLKSMVATSISKYNKKKDLSDSDHPFVIQNKNRIPEPSEITSSLDEALRDSYNNVRVRGSKKLRSVEEQRDVFVDLIYYYYFITKQREKASSLMQVLSELLDNAENNLIVVLGDDDCEPEPDTSCSDSSLATMNWIRKSLKDSKSSSKTSRKHISRNHYDYLTTLLGTRLSQINKRITSQSNNLLANTYISHNIPNPTEEECSYIFLHRLVSVYTLGVHFNLIKYRSLSLLSQTIGSYDQLTVADISLNILTHQPPSQSQRELVSILSNLIKIVRSRDEERLSSKRTATDEVQRAPKIVERINTAVKRRRFGKKTHEELVKWCESSLAQKLSNFPALQNIPALVSALVKIEGNGKLFPISNYWDAVDDSKLPFLTPHQLRSVTEVISILSEVYCELSFVWKNSEATQVFQLSQLLQSRVSERNNGALGAACAAVLHSVQQESDSSEVSSIPLLSKALRNSYHLEAAELLVDNPSEKSEIDTFSNDMRLLLPIVKRASVLRSLSSITKDEIVQQLCQAVLLDDDSYPTRQVGVAIASFEFRRMMP